MLKFGKKVNFRPLLISILISSIFGLAFGNIFSKYIGLAIFILFFVILFNGYYFFNLPGLFSYWEYNSNIIKFNNIDKYSNRLVMMIFPYITKMKEISINDVISIQIIGSTGKLKSLDFMLPVSTAYGIFYSRMSMIKNPLGVELILKNKERIYLDASRDFTYHPKETVKELNTLISSFDPKVRKTDTLQ